MFWCCVGHRPLCQGSKKVDIGTSDRTWSLFRFRGVFSQSYLARPSRASVAQKEGMLPSIRNIALHRCSHFYLIGLGRLDSDNDASLKPANSSTGFAIPLERRCCSAPRCNTHRPLSLLSCMLLSSAVVRQALAQREI